MHSISFDTMTGCPEPGSAEEEATAGAEHYLVVLRRQRPPNNSYASHSSSRGTSMTTAWSRPLRATRLAAALLLLAAVAGAPAIAAAQSVSMEPNMDRMGGDYKGFTVPPDPERCRAACASDNACKAYTYVKPGIKGPEAMCFLKSSNVASNADTCCISGARIESPASPPTVHISSGGRPPPLVLQVPPSIKPTLDPRAADILLARRLGDRLAERLGGKSMGYAVVAILPSGITVERSGGLARSAPDPSPRAMSVDDKFSIASASKLFTGVTVGRMIADRAAKGEAISFDSYVIPFMPSAWDFTSDLKLTSFRDLLLHQAGIRCGAETYEAASQCVVHRIDDADRHVPSLQAYDNTNYVLLRVAISRLGGLPTQSDAMLTKLENEGNLAPAAASEASLYLAHINKLVFAPAGLPFIRCKPTDALPGLSYKSINDPQDMFNFSKVGPGDPWGDMTLSCGSRGLNMSARQLATVMRTIFHSEKIIDKATRDAMVSNGPPFWHRDFPHNLSAVSHDGYHPAKGNKGEIHTLVAEFSNGISVGLIINSRFDGDFLGQVAAAIAQAGQD